MELLNQSIVTRLTLKGDDFCTFLKKNSRSLNHVQIWNDMEYGLNIIRFLDDFDG
jgi:hypothetical protein